MKTFSLFPKNYGFFPYVFLFYLFLPVFYIWQETGWMKWFGYFLILLFAISYRQLYWYTSSFLAWFILSLVIIFILAVFYDPFNIYLGFFPSNFVGWHPEKNNFTKLYSLFSGVIVLSLLFAVIRSYLNGENVSHFLFNFPFLIVLFAAPFGIRSLNRQMELEKKLEEANEKIRTLIKGEERERILRDLHDTLGHTLSMITLQSQLVQKFIDKDNKRAKEAAGDIEKTSRSALRQMRELVSTMRTTTIMEELSQMERILAAADILLHQKGMTDFNSIPLLKQNIIAMCLREAATNVVKHSRAKNCTVEMTIANGKIVVKVEDDGIGFPDSLQEGNGLRGMRERLALIEGELFISKGRKAKIMMTIPYLIKGQKDEVAL